MLIVKILAQVPLGPILFHRFCLPNILFYTLAQRKLPNHVIHLLRCSRSAALKSFLVIHAECPNPLTSLLILGEMHTL